MSETRPNPRADVVVIGGGPAGATVATLVAKAGHRVALYEKDGLPRFHVGESLVPAINLTLERLGVLQEMDRRRFPQKHGVQFFSPRGPSRPFYFSEVSDPRLHHTWQVLRSDFDAMLVENAARAGVRVATETEVVGVRTDGDRVTGVEIEGPGGRRETVAADVVVDASGQRGVLASERGGRSYLPQLANSSVYAHYEGVARDSGVDAGSTLIYRLDGDSWLWFIPLPDVVSIGLVAPARKIGVFGDSPEAILDAAIATCVPLQERLVAAGRTTEVRAVRDFSYRMSADGGAGWLLVGDALGFIDPIYSTGLFLAMRSAELAAAAITDRLAGGGTPDFTGFSREYQEAFDRFLVLVWAFYRNDFHFRELAGNDEHRQGLVDLLTGIVETPQALAVTEAIRSFFDENDHAVTRRSS